MYSLLIIGGTGFFGKSILDSFKRGQLNEFNITKIIVFARNTNKFKLEFPELYFNGVEFINGDISTTKSLPIADYVIHAASSTNMKDYINNDSKNNIEKPVTNYSNIAPQYHSKSKIIYCSSGAVYGKQPLNVEKIDENFKFQYDLSDFSLEKKNYCLGKRLAEKEIINLGKFGLNVSIARCFAFSGKYLPNNQHYALGNFIGQAERGESVIVKASGIVYRSYQEADDLVRSLMKILQVSATTCPIYNVGSDIQISLYDLAKTIAMKYGVKCEFENFNDKAIIDRYVPNTEKLQKILNQKND